MDGGETTYHTTGAFHISHFIQGSINSPLWDMETVLTPCYSSLHIPNLGPWKRETYEMHIWFFGNRGINQFNMC